MTLFNEEYDVLNKIAHKSKMDCWFMIKFSENKGHYVFDLENRKRLSLRQGVKQLVDGMTDVDMYELTAEEIETLCKLLADLI